MRKIFIFTMAAMSLFPIRGAGRSADPIPDGMCRLVMESHDVLGDGKSGSQWILDSSHSTYYNVFFDSFMFFGDYSSFDYMLPEDAEAKGDTDKVVVDGAEEILVPAGIYDWMVIVPDGWSMVYANGDYATVDDFPLLEGKTYKMMMEYGSGPQGSGVYANMLVDTDASLSLLDTPLSGVGLSDSEAIAVTVSNLGTTNMKNVKVSYSVNGMAPVAEEIPIVIPAGESVDYTFMKKADLSSIGRYVIEANLEAEGDMLPFNNSASVEVRHLKASQLPYRCDFSSLMTQDLGDEWIIIDSDGDGSGWMYNEYVENGNGVMGVASCTGCFNGDMTNDDWLISQPLEMKSGKNNISFSVRSLNDVNAETMEVCVGTTPYPESMECIAKYDICTVDWNKKAVTFEIPSDGVYYIAFHSISQNGYNQYIGDVTVAEGEFVGTPEVKINRTLLPVSNACLPHDCIIGLAVTNTGTAPLRDYTLTAYVNDTMYSKTFSDEIVPDQTTDICIDDFIDFSATGEYEVQFLVQNDIIDETVTSQVVCYKPLEELPIISNFTNDINTGIWHSLAAGAWNYEEMFMVFDSEAYGLENGLLCQGFNLNNPVRVKLSYMAHGWDSTGLGIYLGKAGSEIASFERVYYDDYVVATEDEAEFTVNVKEPGCYSLIIVDENEDIYNSTHLRLNEITISEVKPYDIRISDVVSPLSSYMPESQVEGEWKYYATVENRGSEPMTGIKVYALIDGETLSASEGTFDLEAGQSAVAELKMEMQKRNAGESFVVSLMADGKFEDEYKADNEFILPAVAVTEETRAFENISAPEYGTGANGMTLAVGNVYTFNHNADITSILVGLAPADEEMPNATADIAFNIYSLNDDLSIDRRIYSETRQRGAGGMINVDVDDMRLSPGSYYFEIEQLSVYNMGLAYDPEHTGVCYVRTEDGLAKSENYALCIRAIFGKDANVRATDAATIKFTAPTYTKGLYGDKADVAALVRNSGYMKSDVMVSLAIDNNVVAHQEVSLLPYEDREVVFTNVDISKAGNHSLEIKSTVDGDENHGNDACVLMVEADEEESPYLMDFEACNDFDAAGDMFNPRWTTIDHNRVGTTYFWRYEHRHRGEPCGFIAFNPDATQPSMLDLDFKGMYSHSGDRLGLAFSFDPWQDGAEGITESDIWIISPKLSLGTESEFEAYVKTRDLETYDATLEPYRILISETDNSPESFKILGDDVRLAPVEDWGLVSVDLSEYDGKEVYVALQYIGKPIFNTCLMIDDLHVKTNNLSSVDAVTSHIAVRVNGNNIIAPEGSRVYSINGVECGLNNLPKGIYVVKTPVETVKVVIR